MAEEIRFIPWSGYQASALEKNESDEWEILRFCEGGTIHKPLNYLNVVYEAYLWREYTKKCRVVMYRREAKEQANFWSMMQFILELSGAGTRGAKKANKLTQSDIEDLAKSWYTTKNK